MPTMSRTVIGLFDHPARALDAARAVTDCGIPAENVSVVTRRSEDGNTAGVGRRAGVAVGEAEHGAVVGALAGLMLGVSELAVPGIGPAVVGGWLAATLLG